MLELSSLKYFGDNTEGCDTLCQHFSQSMRFLKGESQDSEEEVMEGGSGDKVVTKCGSHSIHQL